MKIFAVLMSVVFASLCQLETQELSRSEFIDEFVCSNRMVREYLESKVCRSKKSCFQCSSRSIKPIFESHHPVVTDSKKKFETKIRIPKKCQAATFSPDRHKIRQICHSISTNKNAEMCLADTDACENLPFNPFSDFSLSGRKAQRYCCEQKMVEKKPISCKMQKSNEKSKFRFHVRVGRHLKRVDLHLSLAHSCCAHLN